jgi:hypothetical protein
MLRFVCILAALALVAGTRNGTDLPGAAKRLPPPEHVSHETSVEIQARMARHGEVMTNLVRAVVLLDRPTIRILANRIADEELIARVGAGREPKHPVLPPEFFAFQDELATDARQLAEAAADGSADRILAERFALLTRTCVSCHTVYLHGRPEPDPVGPKVPEGAARK